MVVPINYRGVLKNVPLDLNDLDRIWISWKGKTPLDPLGLRFFVYMCLLLRTILTIFIRGCVLN